MLLNWCEEITNIDPSINFRATGGWVKRQIDSNRPSLQRQEKLGCRAMGQCQ